MKISLNWIKQYTEIKTPIEELIQKIALQVAEVERYYDLGEKYKGIVVAEVKSSAEHPDSDKLGVYQVDIGQKETIQVVAGDRTLKPGDKVAYFAPGIKLPYNSHPEKNEDIVSKATLRGVESNGMLASARELDLNSDHTKVLRLDTDAKPGSSLAEVYQLNDTIVEIENKALTHRPDCFGIVGMARELSGIQNMKFSSPEWYKDPDSQRPKTLSKEILPLTVDNDAESLCPRYMAVTIQNVQIKDSPLWLQIALMKCNVKPINNVVDITNYLMLLTGQPLHAFDYDKLASKDAHSKGNAHIAIRPAKQGESVTVLGGKTIELAENTILICDSQNPIAIAGIIGGKSTEIDNTTKNIIIESANFDMYSIRRSSMRLGLFTEAVTRFSKGQDPNQCEPVLYQAIKMIEEIAMGTLASQVIDIYATKRKPITITVSAEKLNQQIGTNLNAKTMTQLLENVELTTKTDNSNKDSIIVQAPTFRHDLTIPEDIGEEVARLYGYNLIKLELPTRKIDPTSTNPRLVLKQKVSNIMTSMGATEVLTYNFVGKDIFEKTGTNLDLAYHIKNALSPELEYMRTSVLPSLLEKTSQNIVNGYNQLCLYEINIGHLKGELNNEGLPQEHSSLAFVFTTQNALAKQDHTGSAFYEAKLYISELLKELKTGSVEYTLLANVDSSELPLWIKNQMTIYDLNRAAVISYEKEKKKYYIGVAGEIASSVRKEYKLPNYTCGFELSMHELNKIQYSVISYHEPSKYPKVVRDLCFILSSGVPYQYVENLIKETIEQYDMNNTVEPLDIYQAKDDPERKQITYRLTFQHMEKTLNERMIKVLEQKVIEKVGKKAEGLLKE